MHILRQNYYTDVPQEGYDGYTGGWEEHLGEQYRNSNIASFLSTLQRYRPSPDDEDLITWYYTLLIKDPTGARPDEAMNDVWDFLNTQLKEPNKGMAHKCEDNIPLFYNKYSNLYEFLGTVIPNNFDKWQEKYKINYHDSEKEYVLKYSDYLVHLNRVGLREEHEFHLKIPAFVKIHKEVTIQEVLDFIKDPNPKQELIVSTFDTSALEIPIPEVDIDAINEMASKLNPKSRADISAFGNDVAIEAAKITSQLSYYFTQQAAKPNHTIDLVHEIMDEANNADIRSMLKPDPNWFTKTFSKPQLVPADQMPLAKLTKQAMKLPEMTALDNEAFGNDLKISDHAIAVLDGYSQKLKTYKKALKSQRKRLITATKDEDSLITQITSATMPALIDQVIEGLTGNIEFIKINAFNFSQIGDLTAKTRLGLSNIAKLSTTIQTPAMNAIHQFNAYQLRRFQQFGKEINNDVLEQFSMTASDIVTLNDATPALTLDGMMINLAEMSNTLKTLPVNLLAPINERSKVANGMQAAVIKKELN